MSKFKVGDKVAYKTNPYECIGKAVVRILPNDIMIVTKDYEFIIEPEDSIVAYEKEIDISDDEIYNMLKPKLESMCMKTEYHKLLPTVFELEFESKNDYEPYIPESDVIKAIALAYRSGYLRAKKGRPFKIGGEKE
jgi:hypothetical protein